MKNTFKHPYRDSDFQTLGASRLVFAKGETPSVSTEQKEKAKETDPNKLQDIYEARKAEKEKMESDFRKALQDEKFAEYPEGQFRAEHVSAMEMEITRDGKLLDSTKDLIKAKIELIQSWMKEEKIEPSMLEANKKNEFKYKEEAIVKNKILSYLQNAKYETCLASYVEAGNEFIPAGKKVFDGYKAKADLYTSTEKGLEGLKGSQNYQITETAFDSAVNGLLRSKPEFSVFREDREHIESNKVAKEYRQLFMSLMYTETNKFDKSFPFGPDFDIDDADKNRTSFPDLYKIYYDKNGGGEKLYAEKTADEGRVIDLKKAIKPVRSGLEAQLGLSTLPNLNTDPQNKEDADKNIKAINTTLKFQNDKKGQTPGGLGAFETTYQSDRENLNAMLKLAEAQLLLVDFKKNKMEPFEKGFTTRSMSDGGKMQQEAMEMCVQKFKKALDIVEGTWKEAKLADSFSPELKRLLIVQIYKNGLNRVEMVNGKPVFIDTDYGSVLLELMRSNKFNQNTEHLNGDQVGFVTMAVNLASNIDRVDAKVAFDKNDKALNTPEVEAYVDAEKAFCGLPLFLQKLMEAKRPGGDIAKAWTELPTPIQSLFDNKGDLKAYVPQLLTALTNRSERGEEKILALEKDYGVRMEKNEWDQIKNNIQMAQAAVELSRVREAKKTAYEAALNAKNPDLQNKTKAYVANEIRLMHGNAIFQSLKDYLKDPESPESKNWFALNRDVMEKNPSGKKRLIDSNDVSLTYNSMELQSRSIERKMEMLMDIEMRGLYENYEREVKKDPERFRIENWMRLFNGTKEDRKALIGFLKSVIPNDEAGGKKDLLFILNNMENEDTMTLLGMGPREKNDPRFVALSVMNLISVHIGEVKKRIDKSDPKKEEYENRMDGKTISDYLMKQVNATWQMLAGSGSKPADRIAGGLLLYMAYKSLRTAFGDKPGPYGNLLKLGLVATVADLIVKRQTGKSILEYVNVHSIANSFEGTPEAALVQFNKNIGESEEVKGISINEEQQHEALRQMKNVPFGKLTEWYKTVSLTGGGLRPKKGEPDLFKKLTPAIQTDVIYGHKKHPNLEPDLVGRAAVFKMMKGLFTYMGNQDGHASDNAAEYGLRAAEARWIRPLQPKGTPEVPGDTKWRPTPEFMAPYKGNPDKLDWETVMHIEVRQEDAMKTVGANWIDRSYNAGGDLAQAAADLFRVDIVAPTRAKMQEYLVSARNQWGPEAKQWILELGETGATQVSFAKDRVILEYGAHKDEAGRIIGQHIELVKTATVSVFKLAIGGEQILLNLADKTINQMGGILQTKFGNEIQIPLMTDDPNPTMVFTPIPPNPRGLTPKERAGDPNALNPYYKDYFGEIFAPRFGEALRNGARPQPTPSAGPTNRNYYVENNELASDGRTNLGPIAYTMVRFDTNDLAPEEKTSPYDITLNLHKKVEEQARKEIMVNIEAQIDADLRAQIEAQIDADLRAQVVSNQISSSEVPGRKAKMMAEQISSSKVQERKAKTMADYKEPYLKKYLVPITTVMKVGARGPSHPEAIFAFYRMPLANSREYQMKEKIGGEWMDSHDPRWLKDRPAFLADSSKGTIMNIVAAYGADISKLATVARVVGFPAAEILRLLTAVTTFARNSVNGTQHPRVRAMLSALTLDEGTKKTIDEYCGTAAVGLFALSAYYGGGQAVDKNGRVTGTVNDATAKAHQNAYLSSSGLAAAAQNAGITIPGQGPAPTPPPTPSDVRLKKDIAPIESSLDKVKKLQGVSYNWRTDKNMDRNFPSGRHYGVIAQEIEKVLPEVVTTDPKNGEKAVYYNEIIPILIEAMKEQQGMIDKQGAEIQALKKKINDLRFK